VPLLGPAFGSDSVRLNGCWAAELLGPALQGSTGCVGRGAGELRAGKSPSDGTN